MLYEKLSNGCEVAIQQNLQSNVSAIQVWVHAGSMHETEKQMGMAHLIEHMLFKGTKKRGVGEISKTVEACGGDINAYTTFDRTVYYLSLDSQDLSVGLDLLSDAVFESQFDAEELSREKEVVVEEIRRGEDNPSNQVGRKLFEATYPGNSVGRPIIGYEEGVKGFSRDDLLEFFNCWYQPENMSVVVVSPKETSEVFAEVEKYFNVSKPAYEGTKVLTESLFPNEPKSILIKGDYQQPRLQLAFPAPDVNHRDSMYLELASYALGVGDLSRLNARLREEKKYAVAVGTSLYSPNFRGLFTISAFPVEEHYKDAAGEIARVLSEFLYERPIQEEELNRAKAQLKMQRILENETAEGIAKNLGFCMTTNQGLKFEDYYYEQMDRATCADVEGALKRTLYKTNPVIVGLLPEASKTTEEEVLSEFLDGLKKFSPKPMKKTAQTQSSKSTLEVEEIEIAEGIKLVYRQRQDSSLMSFALAAEGGSRAETEKNAGLYYSMASLFGKATQNKDYQSFTQEIENLGASIEGFSGKDSFGISMQCLTDDHEKMFSLLSESFVQPSFTKMHWDLTLQQIRQTLKSENDQPSRIAIRELKKHIYGQHPYGRPTYGSLDSIEKMNQESLLKSFAENRERKGWVVSAISPLPSDDFIKSFQKQFSQWNPIGKPYDFSSVEAIKDVKPSAETIHIEKKREQTHIVIGFKGLSWDDADRENLDVLSSILGGMGGRLFTRLRDQNSLAYSVSPMTAHGFHPGVFGCYIACAPDKTEQAITQLEEELDKTRTTLVSKEELERAKRYIVGNHESEYQQTDSQTMTMVLMQLFGLGADDFLKYRERLDGVTLESVQAVAQRVFDPKHMIRVIVGQS